jgi:hypothetical protein
MESGKGAGLEFMLSEKSELEFRTGRALIDDAIFLQARAIDNEGTFVARYQRPGSEATGLCDRPVHSNAVILGYTFDDGSVFFGAVLPITNASGPYCVPNLTYYHSMNFMGVLRDRMGVHEDRFLATGSLQRPPLSGDDLCFFGGYRWSRDRIRSNSQKAHGLRNLHFCSHSGLRVSQRLRAKDGGSIHVFDLHARDPHRDLPALDGVSRLRAGAFSAS